MCDRKGEAYCFCFFLFQELTFLLKNKVFESQQSISLKLESTVKGIEDDKKEIERLRNQVCFLSQVITHEENIKRPKRDIPIYYFFILFNQMEKIEASLMKKEVNLSQLEWQNECSRSLDEVCFKNSIALLSFLYSFPFFFFFFFLGYN